MKKYLLALFASALLSQPAIRAAELSGRTLDVETKNPIRDVNIRIIETNQVVSSDKHGEFVVKQLGDGVYHLLATHIAYDHSDTITVNVSGAHKIDISLKPSPWVVNDVVVTGTRSPHLLKEVPVQTEVVSQRDFQRTGARTADEALSSSIGVTINQDLGGQGAMIRGIDEDRVLVLVDGEKAVGRVNGSIDMSQFSLTNVDKIEIVKGTGSTLYGSEAMGGVINIITKKPEAEIKSANLYLDYGSHNSLNPSAEINYGGKRTSLQVGGKYYSTAGFDLDPSTPATNGEDAIKRWNFDTKVTHKLSDKFNLVGTGRFMDENRKWIESEVWGTDTYVYNDNEDNHRYEGSVGLDYLSGDKYSMKLRAFGTYYDHAWTKIYNPGGNLIDTSITDDSYYELTYSSNYVIGAGHVVTYGLDYNYQGLKSQELWQNNHSNRAQDAYLQYEYTPIRSLNFLPGVRWEHHDAFGDKVNPSINVMFAPSDGFKVRGFVGGGFRAPSIKQQYFIFDHVAAGYIVYGASAPIPPELTNGSDAKFKPLKAENSINSSISAEFSYGSIGMHRITYFYNHLEDLIDFTLIGFTPQYWRGVYVYQNISTAITQGIEWESRVRLSKAFDCSFSYNYLYSRDLSTGEKLVNRPDHTIKFFLTGFYDRYGIGATFWGNYQSPKLWVARSNTGGNEGTPPEYAPHRTTLNLNVFKRFSGGVEAFVRVENLLNQVNVTYGYWPKLQLFAGIKYGFGLSTPDSK
jgi:outer membrane receptor for ferrienterochelin and colicins